MSSKDLSWDTVRENSWPEDNLRDMQGGMSPAGAGNSSIQETKAGA